MIDQTQITHDCPQTTVSLKFSTIETEAQVLDTLTNFVRLSDAAFIESFTVTTKTVARYSARKHICASCQSVMPCDCHKAVSKW